MARGGRFPTALGRLLAASRRRLPDPARSLLGAAATVLLFLFAVRLLGAATEAAAPLLGRLLRRVVVADATALGLGWLGAYALANGSVVAALGLSLFDTGLLSTAQLFLVVAGSRLGAAAVVLFIGALDHLQRGTDPVRESVGLGLLAFLLTHTVYLPVTALGSLALPALVRPVATGGHGWALGGWSLALLDPVTEAIAAAIGPGPSFALAVAALFGSLRLFDRVLSGVDTATVRDRLSVLERPLLAFGAGLLVTGLTTSIAFSLGVVVPLYNRGYVRREELVPYVLGANIGTLFDTLLVAVVLGSTVGFAVVLVLLAGALLATLAVLATIEGYSRIVLRSHDRLLADRRLFLGFVVALVVVPLALVVVPLALVVVPLALA
jgi:sodium-dependent phosphate cotransporter